MFSFMCVSDKLPIFIITSRYVHVLYATMCRIINCKDGAKQQIISIYFQPWKFLYFTCYFIIVLWNLHLYDMMFTFSLALHSFLLVPILFTNYFNFLLPCHYKVCQILDFWFRHESVKCCRDEDRSTSRLRVVYLAVVAQS